MASQNSSNSHGEIVPMFPTALYRQALNVPHPLFLFHVPVAVIQLSVPDLHKAVQLNQQTIVTGFNSVSWRTVFQYVFQVIPLMGCCYCFQFTVKTFFKASK